MLPPAVLTVAPVSPWFLRLELGEQRAPPTSPAFRRDEESQTNMLCASTSAALLPAWQIAAVDLPSVSHCCPAHGTSLEALVGASGPHWSSLALVSRSS